jgi:hypothetical protein
MDYFVTPGKGKIPTGEASQTPRLTKSAKRRLRKQRVHERKLQEKGADPQTSAPGNISPKKGKRNKNVESIYKTGDSPLKKTISDQSPQLNSDLFYKSTPLLSTSANSSNSISTLNGSSAGEFLVPTKPKKARFAGTLETPLRDESEDEIVSSANSTNKTRPDTPCAPKSVKNPLILGFPEKLNFSTSSGEGSFSKKPDTPNLPLVSKSPHYNYVNKNTLTQLSREMIRNLNLSQTSNEDSGRKKEELVHKLNKSLEDAMKSLHEKSQNTEDHKQTDKEEKGIEIGVENESCFDRLENVKSVEQLQEGNVIAFKVGINTSKLVIKTFTGPDYSASINLFQNTYFVSS